MKVRAATILTRTRPDPPSTQRLVLPQSTLTTELQQHLGKHINIATATGTKIADLVKMKRPKHTLPNSAVYKIPCGGCDLAYYGETGRGLRTRLGEHKADFRHHRLSNAMVVHSEKEGHLPRWIDATTIHQGLSKAKRKAMEAAVISSFPNINNKPGSLRLAKVVASKEQRRSLRFLEEGQQ